MNTMSDTLDPALGWLSLIDGETWTAEESNALQSRLWMLLEKQIQRKTQGDSTSMRVEDAAELMESITFTLGVHLQTNVLPSRALLSGDLNTLFSAAQDTVLRFAKEARHLYDIALRTVRPLASRSLRDTLRGLGVFFAAYDARLYAQHIPAEIDYQLCHPVPETLQGVCYIREYLQRMLIENGLIVRFDPRRVMALLRRTCPDYGELLVNLYEPVAANVIGLSLLGGGETLLEILSTQGEQLRDMLSRGTPQQARAMLQTAARDACHHLSITHPAAERYLAEAAVALYPRISASSEGFRGVFSVLAGQALE